MDRKWKIGLCVAGLFMLMVLIGGSSSTKTTQTMATTNSTARDGDVAWLTWLKIELTMIEHDSGMITKAANADDQEDLYYYVKQFDTDIKTAIEAESAYYTTGRLSNARQDWMDALEDYKTSVDLILEGYNSNHVIVNPDKLIKGNVKMQDGTAHLGTMSIQLTNCPGHARCGSPTTFQGYKASVDMILKEYN
jgi:hypothetical protein